MSTDNTGIQWTDATWNPVRGCSRISPGCGGARDVGGCYAEKVAGRFSGPGLAYEGLATIGKQGARWTGEVRLIPDALSQPLHWKKPRKIFVNSMSDLFHERLSNEEIAAVFGVMAACPQHTFQVLTKRAERMAEWFEWAARAGGLDDVLAWCVSAAASLIEKTNHSRPHYDIRKTTWPLPNVWIGVSVEDQQRADERIPHLLRVPARVRFLSVEPLLGPVDLNLGRCDTHDRNEVRVDEESGEEFCNECAASGYSGELSFGHWLDGAADVDQPGINWVIVGGESGPGARPMHLDWARSIRDQCVAAGTAFFFKQWGQCCPPSQLPADAFRDWDAANNAAGNPDIDRPLAFGKKKSGALLDGREWREWPAVTP